MERIDAFPFCVENFHVDFSGRLFPSLLGNCLLNAAGRHAERRGWGVTELCREHRAWVLSRLCLEMEEMPQRFETVEIRTWVESVFKMFTNRNFAILRSDGTAYGYARSVWAVIDMETRRPCDLQTLYGGGLQQYVVPDEENLCPIAGHGHFRFRDAQKVRTLEACYSDVDVNGHVNSVKYIEHILNLFPGERYRSYRLHRFEIAYKAESYLGDVLGFWLQQPEENKFEVEVRKDNSDVVCQARVEFVPISK